MIGTHLSHVYDWHHAIVSSITKLLAFLGPHSLDAKLYAQVI